MKHITNWLENGWFNAIRLRQMAVALLVAIALLVVPAFSFMASLQAQAGTWAAQSDTSVDQATIKRIQEKAEDLGDRSERPIGDTGLKNIRKLRENIPETLDLKARQLRSTFNRDEQSKDALDDAQRQAERAARKN